MSYKIQKSETGYNIHEKKSDIIIQLETTEQFAKDLCRKLNLGSGFNGWTPAFIAEKHKG